MVSIKHGKKRLNVQKSMALDGMIYVILGQVGMCRLVHLQELGGWSNYEMVLRYAHLAPEHLAEYANNILDNGHIKSSDIKKAVQN